MLLWAIINLKLEEKGMNKKILFCLSMIYMNTLALSEINLYGPGGPHTALVEIAKEYKEKTGEEVKVNFGPQKSWNDKAKMNADILFGASEQSALAIANDHKENFDLHQIEPMYFRRAIILVKKGNPKNIKGLKDLADKKVGIIVPEGKGESNTSGTGVWEDMIGRTKDINKVKNFRNNIISFTPNSGAARKMFLEDKNVDAWITWIDWAKSNPNYGDVVEIEKELVVYRDFNMVPSKNADKKVHDFMDFVKSDRGRKIFQKYGWE